MDYHSMNTLLSFTTPHRRDSWGLPKATRTKIDKIYRELLKRELVKPDIRAMHYMSARAPGKSFISTPYYIEDHEDK